MSRDDGARTGAHGGGNAGTAAGTGTGTRGGSGGSTGARTGGGPHGGRAGRPRGAAPSAAGPGRRARVRAVRLGPRSVAALLLVSAVGLAAFLWPLVAGPGSQVAAHAQDAPWLFAGLLVLLVGVVTATVAESGLGAKAVAMLGVLAATGAALRPIGAGTAGIEPMFFLMVLSGRVLGPGFGFVLGSLTMFASALLTGGVGPWMPFQMLAMGWFAMGAGLLPGAERLRGRGELLLLAAYGFAAAFAYGTMTNLAGWPFLNGLASSIAYDPDAPLSADLVRFAAYCLATSLGWDLGRAVVTVTLTLLLGPAVLKALRRATRRASFEAPVAFEEGARAEDASGAAPVASGRDPL
ncbi:ABC transporter permease [Streptomyces minutiscleroticus]|uniref:ABC transporter permease n=1 Tax=Streptomyces minutiscleroticus TaxID=68238 RepID=A0A918K6Z7_9ACTN|nr:ABC transporter permease [Streptomyces minutiscleroticus]